MIGISVSVRGSVPSPGFTRPLSDANRRIAKFAHADARLNVARHTRSGETARELRAVPLGSKGVEMRDAAPQAWFLEYGTRPHVIRPRKAKALRFFGSSVTGASGQPIFAKEVNHPGTRADPFMAPAITDNAGLWERMYTDAVMGEMKRG